MAQLLRRFEAYFSNVARNLRRTYLRPFVIVTPNMSKGHAPAWGDGCAPWEEPQLRQGARHRHGHLLVKGQQLWPRFPSL